MAFPGAVSLFSHSSGFPLTPMSCRELFKWTPTHLKMTHTRVYSGWDGKGSLAILQEQVYSETKFLIFSGAYSWASALRIAAKISIEPWHGLAMNNDY